MGPNNRRHQRMTQQKQTRQADHKERLEVQKAKKEGKIYVTRAEANELDAQGQLGLTPVQKLLDWCTAKKRPKPVYLHQNRLSGSLEGYRF